MLKTMMLLTLASMMSGGCLWLTPRIAGGDLALVDILFAPVPALVISLPAILALCLALARERKSFTVTMIVAKGMWLLYAIFQIVAMITAPPDGQNGMVTMWIVVGGLAWTILAAAVAEAIGEVRPRSEERAD